MEEGSVQCGEGGRKEEKWRDQADGGRVVVLKVAERECDLCLLERKEQQPASRMK